MKSDALWDEIGIHRPIAGFWFRLFYEILIIILPIFMTSFFLKVLYPYPTSIGYRATFTSLFVLIFTIFDIGTANTINRYIADENIKNPARMIKYVQYFIWYQAVTGLVQITIISVWAIYFVPETELAYGIWIILTVILKQYPGFPGVFIAMLNSLQQFNKKATVEFFQSEAIQRITEIVFVLLGKWWGASNPAIGELMGIAIGSVFGLYLDDLIVAFIAGYYLSKSMGDYGITFKRMFMVEFDWELVKDCLFFGIRTGFPSIISASVKVFSLTLLLTYVPQYTTFWVLADMAYMIVAAVERLTKQDFSPIFVEAYQNKKNKLCEYYNAHAIRFFMINTGFTTAIMLTAFTILPDVFAGFQLDRYFLAIPFLIPSLIARASKNFIFYPDGIMIAAHKPNEYMAFKLFEEGIKFLTWYLTIMVFHVQDLGFSGIIYVLVLTEYPPLLLKSVLMYLYIHKKVFRLRIMIWQTLVVPIVSTLILYGIFSFLNIIILRPLMEWNLIIALVIAMIVIIVLSLAFFFPLTVYLGGWDDNSIRDFRKVEKMAGPSTFIVRPMAKLIFKTVKISPLHNRFALDSTEAEKEIREILQIREESRKKMIESGGQLD
jgi:hypothetical protein